MKVLIIANPVAGKGKPVQILPEVKTCLTALGFDTAEYLSMAKSDYDGILHAVNSHGDACSIVVIGGDGTLNDVVNALPANYNTPLLVIPGGSGNDFATYLYGNNTLQDVLGKITEGHTVSVDIGICNGRKFINNLGIGLDGWIAGKATGGIPFIPAKLKYHLSILRGLLTYRSFRSNLGRNLDIAVANGPMYGGGYKVAPQADATDGKFDMWLVKPISVPMRPYYLTLVKNGKHKHGQGPFLFSLVDELLVESGKKMPAHLDGEFLESNRYDIRMTGQKLRFIH